VIAPVKPKKVGLPRFRVKLLLAMMLVVSGVATAGLIFAQHNVAENARRELQRAFQGELAALRAAQSVRHAVLAERCRSLARNARIGSALEEAKDLLYPSARDALADVMQKDEASSDDAVSQALHARFYRFLDEDGAVIPPPSARDGGALTLEDESHIALKQIPTKPQIGYLTRSATADDSATILDEVIVMPIFSTGTGQVLGALALGFKPVDARKVDGRAEMKNGIWSNGRLHLPSLSPAAREALAPQIEAALSPGLTSPAASSAESNFTARIEGVPHLVFYKRLNPDSLYPPAYEVYLYPLSDSLARQRALTWQFVGAGSVLLLAAYAASHFISFRLSLPVQALAVTSEENRAQRERVEAALEMTNEELQRSARFSADASHQLKTPVTVLRAGLEELLAGEKVTHETREEISTLVHQTFRLTSIIEDLLLLSRMDAGRLKIEFSTVDLVPLIAGWLDDFGALAEGHDLEIHTELPAHLFIDGEKRYTSLILQNLLENARKYNRPNGRIQIAARSEGDHVRLAIGNTGQPIPAAAQEHIFERFHRGAVGENVPGHGLGLNLARELARLHGGDLRLVRSDDSWTEFEVRFRAGRPSVGAGLPSLRS
jgi:signal transduction histidine kinase